MLGEGKTPGAWVGRAHPGLEGCEGFFHDSETDGNNTRCTGTWEWRGILTRHTEVNAYRTHLAVEGQVSASTQKQALSALLFLYRELLKRSQITVRHGKGGKDRRTMLPAHLGEKLQSHPDAVQSLHRQDLAAGYGRVRHPHALGRKYPHAPLEWGWQSVFPQHHRWQNTNTGELKPGGAYLRNHHASHNSHLPTFFRPHLLESGQDIRTIQEIMRHKDIKTTMIYMHVFNRGPLGVPSHADLL